MTCAPSKRNSGACGSDKERLAAAYLDRQGLTLVARNYRCRGGEIDLVLRDRRNLVFVEVRYRRSSRFGSPAETVTAGKQRRLITAASHFLQRHPTELACRFDVLAITENDRIQWIRDAFRVD
jgi:putative endonuclease